MVCDSTRPFRKCVHFDASGDDVEGLSRACIGTVDVRLLRKEVLLDLQKRLVISTGFQDEPAIIKRKRFIIRSTALEGLEVGASSLKFDGKRL
jgi:hypothetical protein